MGTSKRETASVGAPQTQRSKPAPWVASPRASLEPIGDHLGHPLEACAAVAPINAACCDHRPTRTLFFCTRQQFAEIAWIVRLSPPVICFLGVCCLLRGQDLPVCHVGRECPHDAIVLVPVRVSFLSLRLTPCPVPHALVVNKCCGL